MKKKAITHCFLSNISKLGLEISRHQAAQLADYLLELQRWNQSINLTALTDPEEMIDRLFFDAMTPFCLFPAQPDARWLDVGTGAGFPGLVLKILNPEMTLIVMEPTQKRVSFLTYIVDRLGLRDVTILSSRIEQVDPASIGGAVDVLVTRALSSALVFAHGPTLLADGGHILLQKSIAELPKLHVLLQDYPNLKEEERLEVKLPLSRKPRSLVLIGQNEKLA